MLTIKNVVEGNVDAGGEDTLRDFGTCHMGLIESEPGGAVASKLKGPPEDYETRQAMDRPYPELVSGGQQIILMRYWITALGNN